jgi:hypothetical protein
MGRDAFQKAAEAGDMTALAETLDPNIRFRGPAFAEPAQGREQVAAILSAAFQQVYQDFRYVEVVAGANRTVLLFTARVGDHQMEGAQVLAFGPADTVTELVVMVRPAPAALALGEAILSHLTADPRIQA